MKNFSLITGLLCLMHINAVNAVDQVITNYCSGSTDKPHYCGEGCCAATESACSSTCGGTQLKWWNSCPDGCKVSDWSDIGDNKQTKCSLKLGGGVECLYQCADGYYPYYIGSTTGGEKTLAACYECPKYGTCDGTGIICNAGFYKKSQMLGKYTCTVCPSAMRCTNSDCSPLKSQAGLSAQDSTDITDCYIPGGTYKDTYGVFTLSTNCYYTKTSTSYEYEY